MNINFQSYTVCTQFSVPHSEGFDLLRNINEQTTPNEFDKMLLECPTYKIENCGKGCGTHALSRAAIIGNVELIYHIALKLGGTGLINVGSGTYFNC